MPDHPLVRRHDIAPLRFAKARFSCGKNNMTPATIKNNKDIGRLTNGQ
jgi:hypothetical protein